MWAKNKENKKNKKMIEKRPKERWQGSEEMTGGERMTIKERDSVKKNVYTENKDTIRLFEAKKKWECGVVERRKKKRKSKRRERRGGWRERNGEEEEEEMERDEDVRGQGYENEEKKEGKEEA